jgi:hypothetical protein
MLLYNKTTNVISNTLPQIIPIYISELKITRKMIITNYAIDKSYYVVIGNLFGLSLLRFNYGVNRYLSELYIFTGGLHRRTLYYFMRDLFDISYISYLFTCINKKLYSTYMSFLKKKFAEHTFWSTSYLNHYPCRGQRRRTNASTASKLNVVSKFSTVSAVKKESSVKKKSKKGLKK